MKQKPVATLILQRNLPSATDQLFDHLQRYNDDLTDIYVIESGSDKDKLSSHSSFWANWPEALEKGLHYCRGFNFGLLELDKTGKRYDYYFFVTGDCRFDDQSTLAPLLESMERYEKLGIISPLSSDWGEAQYFSSGEHLKCVWCLPHVAWLMRRRFLDLILEKNDPSYMNYFYDGTNFRGYDADSELIIKGYMHDFATAVESRARFREDHDLMARNADVIKTERQHHHRQLMYQEGLDWMRRKYGFSGKWEMRDWAVREYRDFFRRNPSYASLSILTPGLKPTLLNVLRRWAG